jgi:hypothetical protein
MKLVIQMMTQMAEERKINEERHQKTLELMQNQSA